MENFEYRVSVIVPIYNGSEYLKKCLDSLLRQTIGNNQMEVLLINDGSTDESERICQEYTRFYKNFKYFYKENEGLSATRNYGLRRANGKYIAYLDCDDMYSKETLKNVCDFFDMHYEEIDEITIPIVRYKNGKTLPMHYRYKYETKTGIYDLDEFPFVSQTTINIIVKNLLEDNIFFDETPNFRHEDQAYNNEILMKKRKIGFVEEAEYKYNRDNDTGIVNTFMYPYYIFETTMAYYERLFSEYNEVPRYIQALFVHDLVWKLKDDKLLPFHYETNDFNNAMARIRNLLSKVDVDIITSHPSMNNFHAQYWLGLKNNAYPLVVATDKSTAIYVDNKKIYSRDYFEIIMHKIRVCNNKFRMLAFVKSPVYNWVKDEAHVWVVENDTNKRKLEVFPSVHSYFQNTFVKTNNFWTFDYEIDLTGCSNFEFYFEIELDGIIYPTKYWFMPVAVFGNDNSITQYVRENYSISVQDKRNIRLEKIDDNMKTHIENKNSKRFEKDSYVTKMRQESIAYKKEHRVWLYYDAYTVEKDNGYFQFANDIKHNDGIEKYYVVTNKKIYEENDNLEHFVEFGSEQHKLLYLAAERVFTAYYGFSPISPFLAETNEAKYIDLIDFKTIYLQHGVLHAALRTFNSVERCRAEQIVVSSQFEVENYKKNYHYKDSDLITTGMARYDHINRETSAKRQILYAPSWRKYLTYSPKASNWQLQTDKLVKSDYFNGILAFLNNEKLSDYLEKNDLELHVKLHPIIAEQGSELVSVSCDRIKILNCDVKVKVEEYCAFITDFSSYVFDYACLNRPIMYYVTDYEQFKSGMNHYKELDLPFDKAFGPLFVKDDDVIKYLNCISERKFEPEDLYYQRMKDFFLPLDNCAEKLYQYII